MKKTLNSIVIDILKETGKSLTAREISEIIIKKEPEFCDNKMTNTTKKTQEALISQLIAEIGSHYPQMQKYNISRTADRPKKLFFNKPFNSTTDYETKNNKVEPIIHNQQKEHELYPKLAEYCKSIGIDTLRIDEKKSNKTGGENYNIWLHADVVGFKDLSDNYNKATKECLIEYSCERSFLYSFEVKEGIIKNCDLRKYFFQTVSNSSWANYSYLVAEGIEEKAKEELQLLCASFNIGFIQLNKEEPEESDIVIQAPKTDIDWNMINRISDENPDFRQYLKNISLTYKRHSNPDIQPAKWDI